MRKLFIIAGAALLLASCAKQTQPFQPLVLSAVQEGDGAVSKTSLSGTSVHWSAGDQVAAFVGMTPHTSSSAEILSDTQAKFTFSDLSADASVSYAVYPASAAVGTHEGGATVTVPSEQTAVPDSFGEGAAVCIAKGDASPMVFRNVCGFLAFTFKDSDAASVASIRIIANEPMTGQADVHWNSGDPTVEPSSVKSLNAVKLSGTFESGKTYYVAVFPRASYSGLTIKITKKDGYVSTYTNPGTLTLARKGNMVIARNLALKPVGGNWAEKDPAYIGSTEVVIPVGKVGENIYLIQNTYTNSTPPTPPAASSAPVNLSDVDAGYKWNVSVSGTVFQLYPNEETGRWLNCSTTNGSGNQNCMAVSNENYWKRKYFTWDAACHVLTSDSYDARYLSYKDNAWYGETFPASGSYPAASFSFYVQVP